MLVTLLVLWYRYRLRQYLTASRCTDLSFRAAPWVCGFQTQVQYSRVGLTSACIACLSFYGGLVRTFLFTNPRVVLALEVMLSMWMFYFKSLVIVRPTYLEDFTFFYSLFMEKVISLDRRTFICYH